MAVPSYTSDLTTINDAETTTDWARYGASGNPAAGVDFVMQGTNAIDKQVSNDDGGLVYDNGAGITLGTGDHILIWHFTATPGLTANTFNKGTSIVIASSALGGGASLSDAVEYHTGGSEAFGANPRVARCYVVDWTNFKTQSLTVGSPPYRTVTGTPSGNPRIFGGGLVTTAAARTNLGIDVIRYGTGAYLTAGELTSEGDSSDDPCTFIGYATENDLIGNRYGLFTQITSTIFEMQGKFAIGQSNTQVATLTRFQDSQKTINIVDTPHASSDFSEFIIDDASTVCNWTNITVSPLGTQCIGALTVTTNNPTVSLTSCNFIDFGESILRSNCTLTETTFRSSSQVTQNGASINQCTFDSTTSDVALLSTAATASSIDGCDFTGDNTSHAVNLGTVSSSTSINWNSTFDASTYAASSVASNATSTSGDSEVILVNVASGQTLTISVTGVASPTYRNTGPGTVLIANEVQVTISNVIEGSEVRMWNYSGGPNGGPANTDVEISGGVESIANTDTLTTGSVTFNVEANLDVLVKVFKTDFNIERFVLNSGDGTTRRVDQSRDRVFSNP